MKHEIGEMWKEKEGSKTWWVVQFPKGRMSFKTKKQAQIWAEHETKYYKPKEQC